MKTYHINGLTFTADQIMAAIQSYQNRESKIQVIFTLMSTPEHVERGRLLNEYFADPSQETYKPIRDFYNKLTMKYAPYLDIILPMKIETLR